MARSSRSNRPTRGVLTILLSVVLIFAILVLFLIIAQNQATNELAGKKTLVALAPTDTSRAQTKAAELNQDEMTASAISSTQTAIVESGNETVTQSAREQLGTFETGNRMSTATQAYNSTMTRIAQLNMEDIRRVTQTFIAAQILEATQRYSDLQTARVLADLHLQATALARTETEAAKPSLTPTSSPTPIPSPTPTLSPTPVPSLTPTSSPTRIPSPTPCMPVNVASIFILYEFPAIGARQLSTITRAGQVQLISRLEDSSWYFVKYSDPQSAISGWIDNTKLTVDECAQNIPINSDYRAGDPSVKLLFSDTFARSHWSSSVNNGQLRLVTDYSVIELRDVDTFILPEQYQVDLVVSIPRSGTGLARAGVLLDWQSKGYYSVSVGEDGCKVRFEAYSGEMLSQTPSKQSREVSTSCDLRKPQFLRIEKRDQIVTVWLNDNPQPILSEPGDMFTKGQIKLFVYRGNNSTNASVVTFDQVFVWQIIK